MLFMRKLTISMAIFNSHFDITRGYSTPLIRWPFDGQAQRSLHVAVAAGRRGGFDGAAEPPSEDMKHEWKIDMIILI
jgi:hypothetical protein